MRVSDDVPRPSCLGARISRPVTDASRVPVLLDEIDRPIASAQADSEEVLAERAAASTKRLNDQHFRDFEFQGPSADGPFTFAGKKSDTTWLFTTIELSSRFWPTKVVVHRSYRNTELVFKKTLSSRPQCPGPVLVFSDAFEFHDKAVRNVRGAAAICGQQIKARRNNKVCGVQRTLKPGTKDQLASISTPLLAAVVIPLHSALLASAAQCSPRPGRGP